MWNCGGFRGWGKFSLTAFPCATLVDSAEAQDRKRAVNWLSHV